MSKNNKKTKKPTVKTERESIIDESILKLKEELEESGVYDDELIITVAKIYSNSMLIAYQKHLESTR